MIDLNCHILDGTRYGPGSFDESLEMCHQAVKDGVHTIVATLCWEPQASEPPLPFPECRRRLERLERLVGGGLSLRLGFMMKFSPALPALVRQYGSWLALAGGSHLLVSLPALSIPPEMDGVRAELARLGFSMVVARPECNHAIRHEPERLDEWVTEGAMLQIDAASIVGAYGREARRFAAACMRQFKDSVVVASSARNAGPSPHSLSDARKEIVKRFGRSQARRILSVTPAKIVAARRTT